ncbi:hypothetical protein HPB48_000709 [Haemaphysalis longicornis]|uniref:Uncharacterized protein n=1 Tax=Haemaphysalis longicornis TaxID=44386 RepID=A0A9J6GYV8_HAELO|nr:hypothetical protein HPB48_000709 [Haemaphysalis longicornis]
MQEAKVTHEKSEIRLSAAEKQNVLTLSSSSEKITLNAKPYGIASYVVSPDNSCKGVLYGIGYGTKQGGLLNKIEAPGYEVLACRYIGESQAMVITFGG